MLLLQGIILSIVVIIGKTPYFWDMKKFAIKKGCLMREARRGKFSKPDNLLQEKDLYMCRLPC